MPAVAEVVLTRAALARAGDKEKAEARKLLKKHGELALDSLPLEKTVRQRFQVCTRLSSIRVVRWTSIVAFSAPFGCATMPSAVLCRRARVPHTSLSRRLRDARVNWLCSAR